MQHEAAVDLDGAAEMDGGVADVGVGERNVNLLEQRRQHHVGRLVDDDAERAVLVVLANEGQRVREIGIGHRRHGDQEVVREVGGRTSHGSNCNLRPPAAQLAPRIAVPLATLPCCAPGRSCNISIASVALARSRCWRSRPTCRAAMRRPCPDARPCRAHERDALDPGRFRGERDRRLAPRRRCRGTTHRTRGNAPRPATWSSRD